MRLLGSLQCIISQYNMIQGQEDDWKWTLNTNQAELSQARAHASAECAALLIFHRHYQVYMTSSHHHPASIKLIHTPPNVYRLSGKQDIKHSCYPLLLHPTWLHKFSVPPGCWRSMRCSGNEPAFAFLSLALLWAHKKTMRDTKRSASRQLPGMRFSHLIYRSRSASIFLSCTANTRTVTRLCNDQTLCGQFDHVCNTWALLSYAC